MGTKQLKNDAVTAAKIKKGAVTGEKLADHAVTGAKVDLASLGTVPSAAHADIAANAQTLEGSTAAKLTAASKLACPSETVEVAGLCFEKAARSAESYLGALGACANAGMTLPSVSEMKAFDVAMNDNTVEWAGQIYYDGSELRAEGISRSVTTAATIGTSLPFRCAVPPTN